MFIFERERERDSERQREQGRGREKDTQRENPKKQVLGSEPSAQSPTWGSNSWP